MNRCSTDSSTKNLRLPPINKNLRKIRATGCVLWRDTISVIRDAKPTSQRCSAQPYYFAFPNIASSVGLRREERAVCVRVLWKTPPLQTRALLYLCKLRRLNQCSNASSAGVLPVHKFLRKTGSHQLRVLEPHDDDFRLEKPTSQRCSAHPRVSRFREHRFTSRFPKQKAGSAPVLCNEPRAHTSALREGWFCLIFLPACSKVHNASLIH